MWGVGRGGWRNGDHDIFPPLIILDARERLFLEYRRRREHALCWHRPKMSGDYGLHLHINESARATRKWSNMWCERGEVLCGQRFLNWFVSFVLVKTNTEMSCLEVLSGISKISTTWYNILGYLSFRILPGIHSTDTYKPGVIRFSSHFQWSLSSHCL